MLPLEFHVFPLCYHFLKVDERQGEKFPKRVNEFQDSNRYPFGCDKMNLSYSSFKHTVDKGKKFYFENTSENSDTVKCCLLSTFRGILPLT